MTTPYCIRPARPDDIDALVAFTRAEAREAEGLVATAAAVRRGVEAAFGDPPRARYWLAEAGGQPVGSISIVTEWSNFHGGDYWWVQSLFVVSEHRGAGLVAKLLDHVTSEAREAGALDLRLHAHDANARALRAYERCGFVPAPYLVFRRPLRNE